MVIYSPIRIHHDCRLLSHSISIHTTIHFEYSHYSLVTQLSKITIFNRQINSKLCNFRKLSSKLPEDMGVYSISSPINASFSMAMMPWWGVSTISTGQRRGGHGAGLFQRQPAPGHEGCGHHHGNERGLAEGGGLGGKKFGGVCFLRPWGCRDARWI